jgi:hypothetical protein
MLAKRRRILALSIAVGVAVAIFLFSVLVPVPHSFSMNGVAISDAYRSCTGIDTAQGGAVSFHWSAPSAIVFFVVSCSANQVAYEGNGTSGSGTFVSAGGTYMFGASCPEGACVLANVSGTYFTPLLAL